MAAVTKKTVQLNPDDRQRMQRLSEEVRARLTEMSLIFGRAMEVDLGSDAVLKFIPEKLDGTNPQARGGKHIEIICAPDGSCGCWVDPPGICEYPCGAAGRL